MKIVVTGGAGFVGSNLAVGLSERHPDWEIVAFDNLRRRGAELTLSRLRDAGVLFVHGDVREPRDLELLGGASALVECSAEPSVLAGRDGGVDYLVRTNLFGAFACLEFCRMRDAALVFLSTSRVYPVERLQALALAESETRFELVGDQEVAGASSRGISEAFPMEGPRTLYGATKLAAEELIVEYVDAFDLQAVIDRCGVIAGPWQMGKVDQGVLAYWLLAHHFSRPLRYIGFGGTGKQVRDFLHVDDLMRLIEEQLIDPGRWQGKIVNVGGGREVSLSLHELTDLCREVTGNEGPVEAISAQRPGDIPVYLSDCTRLFGLTDWRPQADARTIVRDTYTWVRAHADALGARLEL
jgi:CDP-paratose 2-epimerase